jgi:predicted RNase H-like HicB family nuclease
VPDVPGAIAQGETEREAVENLVEAIKTVLEVRMEQHLESMDFDVHGQYAVTGRCSFSVPM